MPTTEPRGLRPHPQPWDTGRSTGGSSGGSAAAVAVGHRAHRPRQRRRRVDPHPGQRVRPRRPQADPRPGLARPRVRRRVGGLVARARGDPLGARHRGRCSTPSTGMAPGDPYTRRPPARPYVDEVGADPGRLRIGVMTDRPGGTGRRRTPTAWPPTEAAAALLESLGHRRRARRTRRPSTTPTTPATSSPAGPPAPPGTSTTGAARTGAPDRPRTTSSRSPGPSPSSAASITAAAVAGRPRVAAGQHPRAWRPWWADGLRPAAHAHHRRAAAAARLLRQPAPTTRCTGCSAPPRWCRSRRRSTSPASPPSRCRCTGAPTGLPIGVQLVAAFGPRGPADPGRRPARGGRSRGPIGARSHLMHALELAAASAPPLPGSGSLARDGGTHPTGWAPSAGPCAGRRRRRPARARRRGSSG